MRLRVLERIMEHHDMTSEIQSVFMIFLRRGEFVGENYVLLNAACDRITDYIASYGEFDSLQDYGINPYYK